MTPANLALRIDQGATFRALLRLMQPNLVYKPITDIAPTGPVRLTVEHGLPGDWPVWVEHVRQLPEANRAPLRQLPHMAQVVTATELDLPGINATGTRPEGGQLVYRPPLDLTDATAELRLYEKGAEVGTLPVTVNAGGWVDLELSAAETADLAWRSREYVLDVTLPNGDVLRAYTGTITVEVAGAAAGQVCHGFATAGGDRGQRGAQVVGATFDEDGRLIMTLDDASMVASDPSPVVETVIEATDTAVAAAGESVSASNAAAEARTEALTASVTAGEKADQSANSASEAAASESVATAKAFEANLDADRAESARDASLLSKGVWPTTAAGIGQGVAGTSSLAAGSGGTDGTFDLAFSGGTQVLAPKGRFVVEGGAVTQVIIDYPGYYSAGTPTISFAASSGLSGAYASVVMGPNTPVGAYFSVPSTSEDGYQTLYRVDPGPVAEAVKTGPSDQIIKDLASRTRLAEGPLFSVTDEGGFIAIKYTVEEGLQTPEFQAVAGKLAVSGLLSMSPAPEGVNYALMVIDEFGFYGFVSEVPETPSVEATDIPKRDASNFAYAEQLRSRKNVSTAPVAYDYNVVLMYGQSLSNGQEGWPALTSTPAEPGNLLMIGDSPRPNSGHGVWAPVGEIEWNDLVEVVQNGGQTLVLTPAEQAALTAGAQNTGETGGVAAVNYWRRMHLADKGLLVDPSKKVVFINCGCGGRSVEALSKDATPDLYSRIVDSLSAAKGLADGEGKSIGLVGVIYAQGEYNYRPDLGGSTDKATFKALTTQLFDDIYADAQAVLGPQAPPAFITYQTGGAYTRDDTELSVGMAQLEMSQELDNVYLAAPVYHVVDKGGHLSANGYRWMGQHYGAALHDVISRREARFPLQPIRAQFSGRVGYVDFAVPVPPLQVRTTYAVTSPVIRSDLGFKVTDADGDVAVEQVSIVGATVVLIKLAEDATGPIKVWYAPQSAGGTGNLFDSNEAAAGYAFEYNPGTGQYASENIAALVGKPYPLNNPCVAFCIPAEII